MRYVKRDNDGQVVAHFANEQPYATEVVEDDHPDIKAFLERRWAKKVPTADRFAELAARIERLEKLLDKRKK